MSRPLANLLGRLAVRLCREERGGADPGQDELEEFDPAPHWQCPFGPAQLAFELCRLAVELEVLPTPDDWEMIAEVSTAAVHRAQQMLQDLPCRLSSIPAKP